MHLKPLHWTCTGMPARGKGPYLTVLNSTALLSRITHLTPEISKMLVLFRNIFVEEYVDIQGHNLSNGLMSTKGVHV